MIVADTNVVSEFMRPEPSRRALSWAESVPAGELALSVVSVQEIEYGIARLPAGRRRERLERAWQRLLSQFERSLISYDRASASATARVLAHSRAAGRPMSLGDAQIAGTCLAHDCTLATRNTQDFDVLAELAVIDPFAEAVVDGRPGPDD